MSFPISGDTLGKRTAKRTAAAFLNAREPTVSVLTLQLPSIFLQATVA